MVSQRCVCRASASSRHQNGQGGSVSARSSGRTRSSSSHAAKLWSRPEAEAGLEPGDWEDPGDRLERLKAALAQKVCRARELTLEGDEWVRAAARVRLRA
jgi:hypothetical protein